MHRSWWYSRVASNPLHAEEALLSHVQQHWADKCASVCIVFPSMTEFLILDTRNV